MIDTKPTTPIVQQNNPVLRKIAEPVSPTEITSTKIKKVLTDMQQALAGEDDGVALAAPQIAISLRIFIISKNTFEKSDAEEKKLAKTKKRTELKHLIFINPVIERKSRDKHKLDEGCLSVRWLYGRILRSDKAQIRAYDENGKVFTCGASGLLAQVFQHEVDHLNGILFIDTAEDLQEIHPKQK